MPFRWEILQDGSKNKSIHKTVSIADD